MRRSTINPKAVTETLETQAADIHTFGREVIGMFLNCGASRMVVTGYASARGRIMRSRDLLETWESNPITALCTHGMSQLG